ncbi:MAG: type II and III secretion system protein [Candidatus Cloacimonetes bacterium]|nr:type II and III secretion system protein [Candidatus Cloacimonadota bacterium]
MKQKFIIFFILLTSNFLFSQNEYVPKHSKAELITLSRSTSFVEAMRTIETFSEQYENRKIVNMSTLDSSISIPINQLYWKDALLLLVQLFQLELEELPGIYIIEDQKIEVIELSDEEKRKITADSKLIKISGILFKADKSFARALGIDWSTFLGGKVNANINFKTTDNLMSNIADLSASKSFNAGGVTVDVNTLLKFMESNQKGTVIARPMISVLSGRKGYMQVGQNFSIKTIDEEGNTTDDFFETGIILQVEPKVIENERNDLIYLNVSFEKSTATPGEISTIINKSQSTTELLLFDGEEAMIGGLYDTDTTTERIGVPFLKDLPWWVFGLKYIFGYNSIKQNENELIVILKAEIITPVKKRLEIHKKLSEQLDAQKQDFNKVKDYFKDK